jgi:hypothetical protein
MQLRSQQDLPELSNKHLLGGLSTDHTASNVVTHDDAGYWTFLHSRIMVLSSQEDEASLTLGYS